MPSGTSYQVTLLEWLVSQAAPFLRKGLVAILYNAPEGGSNPTASVGCTMVRPHAHTKISSPENVQLNSCHNPLSTQQE